MMYCPRCGTDNLNGASFCRACGADIRLVPQAMTGHLPTATGKEAVTGGGQLAPPVKSASPARVEKAFENIFLGLAFLLIFSAGLLFFRGGFMMWIWFIIPAFACIGSGAGQYLRYKDERGRQAGQPLVSDMRLGGAPHIDDQTTRPALKERNTSEMFSFDRKSPPASVTEGTTRYLDAERRESPTARTQNEQAE